MGFQYSYLIGDLVLLVVWLILFLWRKDVRKEMLVMSLIFGFAGFIVQLVYTADWWHPLTLTNTSIGIEDFLFGFAIGGIAAVIYEEIFKKRIRTRKPDKKREFKRNENFLFISLTLFILFFGSFYLIKLNSFYSSIIAFLIPTFIMWAKRKDLIFDSLASGFLLMFVSFLAFIIPEFVTPGWVSSAWHLENLSGIIILKAPLEDVVWFFLVGAFIGPLYEFWQEGRLVNEGNKNR